MAAVEARELPFVVGILGDLSGQPLEPKLRVKDRKFIDLDRDNFDDVLARIRPRVAFKVDDKGRTGTETVDVDLQFTKLADFEPGAIAGRLAVLAPLLEERLRAFGAQAAPGDDDRVSRLDDTMSAQLSAILHAEPFRRLEATWRGVYYLVTETETSPTLKLRVLDVSKQELLKDVESAPEFDQTTLFKKIYEEEYGTFGGEPLGLLLGDYEFGSDPRDLALLAGLSRIAAAAQAPFIAGASPALFNLERFAELSAARDLAAIFDTVEFARWRAFRESEDSRYVGLTMPRILLRRPHRAQWGGMFRFDERIENTADLLWGNAAYALGACVTNAFAKYPWCAAIRGVEGGGLVEGLPTVLSPVDNEAPAAKAVTEIIITDRREKELADLGLIPLVGAGGRDYAAFFSMQSCNKPRRYDSEAANANSRLWTQLQYVLTASRFGHYLRCIMRDRIGSSMSRGQCQHVLQQWLDGHVLQDGEASVEHKAKYPLAEAHVEVESIPGKSDAYRAVVYLRPHFQLDELSVLLRLVVDLPTAAP